MRGEGRQVHPDGPRRAARVFAGADERGDRPRASAITGALEIDKVGAGILTLNGALAFDKLAAVEGTVRMGSAVLHSLDIAAGATVIVTTEPPSAPGAPEFLAGAAAQAVPEPGSAALLIGGILTLLGRRRRSA